MPFVKLHTKYKCHTFFQIIVLLHFSLQEDAPQQGEAVGHPKEELLLQVRPPRRRGGQ